MLVAGVQDFLHGDAEGFQYATAHLHASLTPWPLCPNVRPWNTATKAVSLLMGPSSS